MIYVRLSSYSSYMPKNSIHLFPFPPIHINKSDEFKSCIHTIDNLQNSRYGHKVIDIMDSQLNEN